MHVTIIIYHKCDDNPDLVAVLLRSYGVSVTSAIEIIRRQRPHIEIAPQYMNLLDVWATRFTLLGAASLCIDCSASARAMPKKKVQFLGV